jgi:hypothetical protein
MVDLGRVATLLLWPAIGLIAWWARPDRPERTGWWLAAYLVLGPLMLVEITWRWVVAGVQAAERRRLREVSGPTSGSSAIGQVDDQEDVASRTHHRRRRRRH